MSIAELIPVGHKNAVGRDQLRKITGMSDREVRDSIHWARRDTVIINAQDGAGYFTPDMEDPIDRSLLKKYVMQEENRIKSTGWSLKAARRLAKEYQK